MSLDKSQDRRSFLSDSFRSIGRLFADAISNTVVGATGGKRYLRPPGAIDEAAFLLSCTRCGDCATACPTNVIKFLTPTAGAAVGTPYIDPTEKACDMCGKCMPACKPKALLTVTDSRKIKMGVAEIDPASCWTYKGQPCQICYLRCPFPDEAIRMADGKPQIIADACTGCGLCVYTCVSTPVSIKILPRN